jgi:hypothetical protein
MSLDGKCKRHGVMVKGLKPWVEPSPRDSQRTNYKLGDCVWNGEPGTLPICAFERYLFDDWVRIRCNGKLEDVPVSQISHVKPGEDISLKVSEPCCAEDKLEPDFPGMIFIPEGYEAEVMTETGQSFTAVSGIAWVKESRVLMIRKVSE